MDRVCARCKTAEIDDGFQFLRVDPCSRCEVLYCQYCWVVHECRIALTQGWLINIKKRGNK
jgi:hypothetical protein